MINRTGPAIVRGVYEALAADDAATALEAFDPQVVLCEPESLPYGGVYRGIDEVATAIVAIGHYVDFAQLDVYRLVGDHTCVVAHVRGRWGEHNDVEMRECWTIEAGLVVRIDVFYWDTAALRDLERNKQIARDFFRTGGAGDIEAFTALLAADAEMETMGTSIVSVKRNRDEIVELVGMLDKFTAQPLEFEFLGTTAEEDRVAIEARGHGTLVDGRPYNNTYHCLFWIRDGKIARMHEYIDTKYTDEALAPLLAAAPPD